MILSKMEAGDRSIKDPEVIQEIFEEADINQDGRLDFEEWKTFSAALSFKMTQYYGDTYVLTEDQLKVRHEAFDYNKKGGCTYDEFMMGLGMKKEFYASHYPKVPSQALQDLWEMESQKFLEMSADIQKKFTAMHK